MSAIQFNLARTLFRSIKQKCDNFIHFSRRSEVNMATLSLLEDCQNIFEKNHEIWKSYFSRWETLAGLEEDLPDETFLTKKSGLKKKQKNKTALLKNKRKLKEKVVRKKKLAKKNKNKTVREVIERSKGSGNENLPEKTDNKQLEMHLRTIFMDILKANKNKWEVFAVLSRTFSHVDVTIKGPHSLCPNHQLALPFDDIERSERNLLFGKVEVFCPKTSLLGSGIKCSDGIRLFESSFPAMNMREKEAFNYIMPRIDDNTFREFKLCVDNTRQLFPNVIFTPPNERRIIFNFKSCPPSLPNTSHCDEIKLKPLALDFRHESTPKGWRKIKDEYFCERNIPEMNITREEKRFGSLCLHKRANDLNMENSNFITPERNSSKRKCFSENILQRKRRRPTKLFFDFWDSSDSESDEQTNSSTPRIGCHSKARKIEVAREMIAVESDSDESDSIFR